jgi:hypothetical protein
MYAAPFLKLNDPMEGRYLYASRSSNSKFILLLTKNDTKYRILSLSRKWNNTLMWSHYADNHRGVVIGMRLPKTGPRAIRVKYVSNLIHPPAISSLPDRARFLLTRKHRLWVHESEYRVLTDMCYVRVELVEIILGVDASIRMERLILKLVEKTGSHANVVWMDKKLLDVNT